MSKEIKKSDGEGLKVILYMTIFSLMFYFSGMGEESFFTSIAGVMVFSLIYFIYYIVSEGKLPEMLAGILIAIIVVSICSISVFLIPFLILYVLIQIKSMWDTLKALFPDLCFSIVMWSSIYCYYYYFDSSVAKYSIVAIYFLMALSYSGLLMARTYKSGLLKFSIMALSGPLTIILVVSIFNGLRSLFQSTITTATNTITSTQNVAAHMRGDTFIQGYTRNVAKEVTTTTTATVVGSGGAIVGSANSISKVADEK